MNCPKINTSTIRGAKNQVVDTWEMPGQIWVRDHVQHAQEVGDWCSQTQKRCPKPSALDSALSLIGHTQGYARMLPDRKSSFRVRFRPGSNRESLKIGPPAGRGPAGGPILRLSRLESGRNPTRKADFRPGSTINIMCQHVKTEAACDSPCCTTTVQN